MPTLFALVFFDGFESLGRVLIATPVLYFAVIVMIRISGKRSTSQMNNFDWIVTVAMGSLVASPILLKDVVVAEALLGIALLLALQFCLTALTVRSDAINRLVRADPTTLLRHGAFCEEAMRDERVSRSEVRAAIRQNGIERPEDVKIVILEADAKLSVMREDESEDEQIHEPKDVGTT